MSEWRDISTAPTAVTILVGRPDGWSGETVLALAYKGAGGDFYNLETGRQLDIAPTAWVLLDLPPLPQPPEPRP